MSSIHRRRVASSRYASSATTPSTAARTIVKALLSALTLAMLTTPAQGQASNVVSVAYLQGQRPAAPDAIATLGTDLFGDKINLYNGSFSFEQTDVELPGNSTLRVALDRQHSPGRQSEVRGVLGDWDLNVPRIEGTFADPEGFVPVWGSVSNRCSGFNMPPYVSRGSWAPEAFTPDEYWSGTNLVVPGHGSQEVLVRTHLPGADSNWTLVTRNLWTLRCDGLANAPGQGFVARSPEGVTYHFKWMATRPVTPLRKGDAVLARRDIFLMATLVTDRFGNWVKYHYNPAQPMQLESIEGSDGRLITISYAAGRVSEVSDGSRRWLYQYDTHGDLQHVVLPDGSRWTFSLRSLVVPSGSIINEALAECDAMPPISGRAASGWMEHPSGARGTFDTNFLFHGRTHVDRVCTYHSHAPEWTNGSVHPHTTASQTLTAKTLSGPGMPNMTWQYISGNVGAWASCTTCTDRKTVEVREPNGARTRHIFGIRWRQNDGQLLKVEETDGQGNVLRSREMRYRTAAGQSYPDGFGSSVRFTTDLVSTRNRPMDWRETTQQNVWFRWEVQGDASQAFDAYARPLRTRASSGLGYARTMRREYRDYPSLWVMGQTYRVANLDQSPELEVERNEFHASTGLPYQRYSFGRLDRQWVYHGSSTAWNGLLWKLSDGAGNTTTFDLYHRGQPQRATFADGTAARQTIHNIGVATDVTNEAGTKTQFQLDAMGRVARIVYPPGDPATYCDTTIEFWQSAQADTVLPAKHWRQRVSTCGDVTDRWLDGLWRVRLEWRRDTANPTGTGRAVETRYDTAGNKVFESLPQRSIATVGTAHAGTHHTYDALKRLVRSELRTEVAGESPLVTQVAYLPDFTKRVTNPRGFATTYGFQAFDEPGEDQIAGIALPENVSVSIARDRFGKPTAITRTGPLGTGTVAVTRSYLYDVHQRLCRTVEPESGATVQGYDAANNIAWRVSGQPASASCAENQQPAAARITFEHDTRNRLLRTTFGDGRPQITRTYTADGLPAQVTSGSYTWAYQYNNARVLTRETFTVPGYSWPFTRAIDQRRNVASLSDPWGTMHYSPDALGRPTQVSGYATAVTYHPNGTVQGYLLNNGVQRTVTLNGRGLPERWKDVGASAQVIDDLYSYDANGNVTAIQDLLLPAKSRSMTLYDGLDRLRTATGPWGSAAYTYDGVDNLRTSVVGNRSLTHQFADGTNRLTGLSGSQSVAVAYDARGNVVQRGSRSFTFDIANRMRSASGAVNFYDYDGFGRRSWVAFADGRTQLNAYGWADPTGATGRLLFSEHSHQGQTRYVYLGGKLIAEHNAQTGVRFAHTDALGSPVAWTSASGTLVAAVTRYEPYGATAEGPQPASIGFTGHVNDGQTGLVYMQQRYYDPIAGRFLSVDPVTTDAGNGALFSRYMYAANNPFTLVDPDGRCTGSRLTTSEGMCQSTGGFTTGSSGVALGMQIAKLADQALTGDYGNLAQQAAENGQPLRAAGFVVAGAAFGVANIVTLGNGAALVTAAKGISKANYSVVFETIIAKTGAGTRGAHKTAANVELAAAMANKETRQMLSSLGVVPTTGKATPAGFRWHHSADRPGVMQLVPEHQHTFGSQFWDALHPNGSGGFANWGKNW